MKGMTSACLKTLPGTLCLQFALHLDAASVIILAVLASAIPQQYIDVLMKSVSTCVRVDLQASVRPIALSLSSLQLDVFWIR